MRNLEREEQILLSLRRLDYLSRSQLQKLHGLGGERNARRVMASLGDYLSSFRGDNGETIFYLNKAGRERVGAEKVRAKLSDANHYLMRNDAYLFFKASDWKNEMKFTIPGTVQVIPDAYFLLNMRRHFLEIDHLQSMAKNKEKLEKYRKLKVSNLLQERLRYFPPLIWVTMTETRKKHLESWSEGLESKIYLWHEIK
jgi:hypothetical protein